MPDRKTPVSLRISQSDAEFIAGLKITGATTPSEKIRTLIKDARTSRERKGDYRNVLEEIEGRVHSTMDQVRQWEHTQKSHSELIALFAEWLPEVEAEFLTALQDKEEDNQSYEEMEKALTDRMARLFERILRLLVVPQGSTYQPEVFVARMATVLELAKVVNNHGKEE